MLMLDASAHAWSSVAALTTWMLKDGGEPLPDTHTQPRRGHGVRPTHHLMNQRGSQSAPAASERMADGDRAATVGVHVRVLQIEFTHAGDGLAANASLSSKRSISPRCQACSVEAAGLRERDRCPCGRIDSADADGPTKASGVRPIALGSFEFHEHQS